MKKLCKHFYMCIPCVILIHLYTPIYLWQKNKIRIYIATSLHLYNPPPVSCRLPHLYIIYITSSLILAVHITKRIRRKRKECRLYKRYKARNLDRVLSCVHHVVARIFPSLQRLFILYYYVYPRFSLYSIFTLLYTIIVFSFCGALLWNKSGEKNMSTHYYNMIRIICK